MRQCESGMSRRALLITLPGLATAPSFMDGVRASLCRLLDELGYEADAHSLYAYGDWGRRLLPQIGDIAYDYAMGSRWTHRSIATSRYRELRDRLDLAIHHYAVVLLVGHSGGGIAGLHAAREVRRLHPHLHTLNVLIGSPRCRVLPEERDRVLYMAASWRSGRPSDPVSLIGSWGGWERTHNGLMRWNRYKHAPSDMMELPIVGGHPDYFRHAAPYVDVAGRSNLQVVMDALELWLEKKLEP
ncbi:hypothetical protein [Paenibacillus sp. YYML68]|uniref:hypothetical protein n=1 Tax=Paenibacillus sp. YYML68 TaxID=2909250 RepID=UPI002492698E|nr:hypothetical protein [Paenibacillus sp. YYML68]